MKFFYLICFLLISCAEKESYHQEVDTKLETKTVFQKEKSEPVLKVKPFVKENLPHTVFKSSIVHSKGEAIYNIKRAAELISPTVLLPGEVFSFNKIVGERTEERGFKSAPILFAGVLKPGMGGGICQVSTSLYKGVMYTGLEVIERFPHSRPSSYISKGMDASINWPRMDFKFKNNTNDKVIITIVVADGKVTSRIEFWSKPKVNPDIVSSIWVNSTPIPFRTDYIESKYIKKNKLVQKGEIGQPGYRVWKYGDRQFNVFSTYKPVSEVIVIPVEEPDDKEKSSEFL